MWVARNRAACIELTYWRRAALASGVLMVTMASALSFRVQSQNIAYVMSASDTHRQIADLQALGTPSCKFGNSSCAIREVAKSEPRSFK